jgi:hypothetical protein
MEAGFYGFGLDAHVMSGPSSNRVGLFGGQDDHHGPSRFSGNGSEPRELNWWKEKERLLTTRLLPRHKNRIICFPELQDLFILTRVLGLVLFRHMLWCKKRFLCCSELLDLFILIMVLGLVLNLTHADLTTASTATSDTNLITPLTNLEALSAYSIKNCDEVVIKEEDLMKYMCMLQRTMRL